MDPTSTEHHFRFPRRPFRAAWVPGGRARPEVFDTPSPSDSKTSASDIRASLQDLKLDFTRPTSTAQGEMLRASTLPQWESGGSGGGGAGPGPDGRTIDDLHRADPLATEIWRFFTQTKQLLPHKERMENMMWRMMHLNLRKRRKADAKYA